MDGHAASPSSPSVSSWRVVIARDELAETIGTPNKTKNSSRSNAARAQANSCAENSPSPHSTLTTASEAIRKIRRVNRTTAKIYLRPSPIGKNGVLARDGEIQRVLGERRQRVQTRGRTRRWGSFGIDPPHLRGLATSKGGHHCSRKGVRELYSTSWKLRIWRELGATWKWQGWRERTDRRLRQLTHNNNI